MEHELPKVWSDNLLSLYIEQQARLRGALKMALEYLDSGTIGPMYEAINTANGNLRTMSKCMESSNLIVNRVRSLADEVTSLRNGIGVSYSTGADPTKNIEAINAPFHVPTKDGYLNGA